jgi:hypothetical protein
VKRLIFFVIISTIGYAAYQKDAVQKREKLVGVWGFERNFQGGWYKLVMNLKPTGDATVEVDATMQGRVGSREAAGRWKYRNSNHVITFDHGDIPVYKIGQEYGGKILTMEPKTLSYKSETGVETWTRLR